MKPYHVKNMKQIFVVENLPKVGFELKLKATDAECVEIAAQMGVEAVSSFTASLILKQWRRGGVHIEGEYQVELTQNCIISLEPFDSVLQQSVDQKFFSSTKIPEYSDKKEVEMIDNDLDPPEALVDGNLDISDYLVESVLLHLDPYPRKPDSDLETLDTKGKFEINQPNIEDEVTTNDQDGDNGEPKAKSNATHKPFADLAKLLKDK